MDRVQEQLEKFGIHVLVISEAATELITAGVTPDALGIEEFQKRLLTYQRSRELHYRQMAEMMAEKNPVILCDRGVLDCAAYMGEEAYRRMLETFGYSQSDLMHSYDLVVHLVTAADGAEEYYTLANNAARSESPEEARALDAKTLQAWLGHPHHIVVDNSTDFATKMNRALTALGRRLNMPEPLEIERKFLVVDFQRLPQPVTATHIVQHYLVCKGPGERRIRMRLRDGERTYFYTEKLPTGVSGTRIERERQIGLLKYLWLKYTQRDRKLRPIEKVRYSFPYAGKVFELDQFHGPLAGLVMLEVELQRRDEEVQMPPGVALVAEVTDDKRYKNRNLAESGLPT